VSVLSKTVEWADTSQESFIGPVVNPASGPVLDVSYVTTWVIYKL